MARRPQLIERGWDVDELIERMRDSVGSVRVGIFDGDLAPIAAFNEFGTEDVPERSFFRTTMEENEGDYAADLAAATDAVLTGRARETALDELGGRIAADIQQRIEDIRSPPNAASTLRQKSGSNPLIDDGDMRDAVTYEVESGGPR